MKLSLNVREIIRKFLKLPGGVQQIIEGLRDCLQLEEGVELHVNAPCESMEFNSGRAHIKTPTATYEVCMNAPCESMLFNSGSAHVKTPTVTYEVCLNAPCESMEFNSGQAYEVR